MIKSTAAGAMIILMMGSIVFFCGCISHDEGLDLIKAAEEGDLQKVQSLLQRGADVNAKASDGDTALIIAVGGGIRSSMAFINSKRSNGQLVELLLDRGADINAKGRSGTPLSAAAASCNTEMVKLLLRRGSEVNAREYCGETALFWATFRGCIDTVRVLLEHGADVNIQDQWGISPLMLTRRNHYDLQYMRDTHPMPDSYWCIRLSDMSLRPEDTPPNEELVKLLEAHGAR